MERIIRAEAMAVIAGTLLAAGAALAADWPQYGGDIRNSRNQAGETAITPANVGGLVVKWTFDTTGGDPDAIGGDISATPSVQDGYLYFGDWNGGIHKVDAATGAAVWSVDLSSITGFPDRTRHTPAIAGDLVIFGNQAGRVTFGQGGAKLVALNKSDGSLAWVRQLDTNGWSVVTSSPTVVDGVAYVGVASFEEAAAGLFPVDGLYTQSFRGSVAAVDVASGLILWQTYTAPVGFTGNSVWGSAPAVDLARNQLYVATGNNFSAPASYHACIEKAKNANQKSACNPGGNYFDSVLALKLTTGEVNWVKRVEPYDTWNLDCFPALLGLPWEPNTIGNCPQYDEERPDLSGPDFDFAQAPILYTASGPGNGRGADYVGVGQKSGVYWALRPSNGDVLWSTRTGPGGLAGGHQWGSASDGERIYTSNANSFRKPYSAPGISTQAGIFSALDGRTGSIIWQIANPESSPAGAPATIANGVMYVCSGGPSGYMYALDAATGAVLWSFASGTHCGAGAAVANGVVYWGTGYHEGHMAPPGGGKLYAFELAPAP